MTNQKKRRFLSLLLTLLTACSLIAGTPLTAAGAQISARGSGNERAIPSQDIVILYTNDVHCGIDDNIGYAGLALYKRQMKRETPYVTLVDAGDAIQGAPIGTLSDGGYLIDIMNKVGYDFAVPGNHEFDYRMPRFLELAGKLDCGYYSCNFTSLATGKPVFAPYKMFSYGDTQVAFVGICTPESFTKSSPAYFQDGAGNYLYGFCEDNTGEALYSRIQETVDAARAAGADYIIAVGHLGENGITERWSSDRVVAATSGIDALIDGHSHETVPAKMVKNKEGREILITQTGTKLENIGKMTIKTDGTIKAELVAQVPGDSPQVEYTVRKGDSLSRIAKRELGSYDRWTELYAANRSLITDPDLLRTGMKLVIPGSALINAEGKAVDYATDAYIKGIEKQYQETLKVVLGYSDYNLTTLNPATGQRAIRNAETNLGDLTADAYRMVLGADIGLSNGGGIRADIKTGNITYNDTLAVFPYGNMGCVVEATGRQIRDALEMASRNYPEESGGFLQVSGLTYRIDPSVSSGVKVDDKGNFIKVDGAYRVADILVDGEPLDLDRIYTVASHNYMLKEGGDGMVMFGGCNVIQDDVMVDVDILSAYINNQLGGSVGADYAEPAGQGRIVIR